MFRNLTAAYVLGLFVFGVGASARADTTTTPAATTPSTTTPTTTTPGTSTTKKSMLTQLHHAHELLANADHDYDGHRAKAAEEVHAALKEVMGKKAAKAAAAKSGTKATTKAGAHHEAQGTSDDQLKEALSILKSVQSEVSSKHPKVSGNINKAVSEINTALKLK